MLNEKMRDVDIMSTALNRQEFESLRQYAEGKTIPEISQNLNFSEFTISQILRSAEVKLHAHHAGHAVALAIEQKLI